MGGTIAQMMIPDTDPPEQCATQVFGEEKKLFYENLLQQAARDGDYEELAQYLGDAWLEGKWLPEGAQPNTEEERPDPDAVDLQFGQSALANAAEGAVEDEDESSDPPVNFTKCVKLLVETQHGPIIDDDHCDLKSHQFDKRPKFTVDILHRDKELETALMSACISGNYNTVEYLIQKTKEFDASPKNKEKTKGFEDYTHLDDRDDDGRTALIYAAKELNPKCCKLLIAAKANVMIKSFKGRTARDYVKKVINESKKRNPEYEVKDRAQSCLDILKAEEDRVLAEEEAKKLNKSSGHNKVLAELKAAESRIEEVEALHQSTKKALAERDQTIALLREQLEQARGGAAAAGPEDDQKGL